jgi:hypothetical protein
MLLVGPASVVLSVHADFYLEKLVEILNCGIVEISTCGIEWE